MTSRFRWPLMLAALMHGSWAAAPPDALKAQVHAHADLFDVSIAVDPPKTPLEQGFWLGFGMNARGEGFALHVASARVELFSRRPGHSTPLGAVELPRGFWLCPRRTITLSVRPRRVFVSADGERLLAARADRVPGDGIGMLGLPKAALVGKPAIEKRGRPRFGDAFAEPTSIPQTWTVEAGEWQVEAPVDPLIALNENTPMYSLYTGGGARAAVTAGHAFWDFYAAEVTCRLRNADSCGLAFYWTDNANHGELVLLRDGGSCTPRLRWVCDGQERFLTASVRFEAQQWHRLRVEALDDKVWGFVDGRLLLAAHRIGLHAGKVGLVASGQPAAFDDMVVSPFDAMVLTGAEPVAVPAEWPGVRVRAGLVAADTTNLLLEGRPGGPRFDVTVDPRQRTCTMRRWEAGAHKACGRAPLPEGPAALLDLTAMPGRVACAVGASRFALSRDTGFRATHVACAGGGDLGKGSWVRAEPWQLEPAVVYACDFDSPVTMLKSVKSDRAVIGTMLLRDVGWWSIRSGRLVTYRRPARLWYAEPCPGDTRASIDVADPSAGVGLRIAADAREPGTGYAAALQPAGKDVTLTLSRGAEAVGRTTIPGAAASWPRRLFVERDGPFVAAGLGDARPLVWRDPDPLPGSRVGIDAAGGACAFDNLRIVSLTGLQYPFERIEPAWREAGGEWMLHTGLSCIPWSYWLTADGRKTPAVIWHRGELPADVAVRVDVSEITIGTDDPDTTHYHFPYHDITVALAADGKDLHSGYAVEIGADGGRCARIRRQGKVIFETYDFTITMGSHCNSPRQVRAYVRKLGRRLIVRLNGTLLADLVDPKPLGAGYVALSAKDCRANFSDVLIAPDTAMPAAARR